MQIDPSQVKWDTPAIDPKQVKWDESPSIADSFIQHLKNAAGGAVRGAGSIGATIMAPVDMASDALAGKGLSLEANRERRAAMDAGLQSLGADPNSLMYKGGKLAGEIAGTAGAGGVLANGVRAAGATRAATGMEPLAEALATALQTGGFRVGQLAGTGAAIPARIAGGAATGAVTAGMANPEEAGAGALVGGGIAGAAPMVASTLGAAGRGLGNLKEKAANRLMQSAIKPTIAQLRSGDARVASEVLLSNGINPTQRGVEKLGDFIGQTDDKIGAAIANSNAVIDKGSVLRALDETRSTFGRQATPQADLQAIQTAQDSFLAHPMYSGPSLPVQAAQDLKRGTYQVLAKKYGQLGSADTEAQKAIARGLKDEIAAAVPGVGDLNKELGRLLVAKEVAERRALMEANKNPLGLTALAPSSAGFAAFLADRSALLKSLAARGIYNLPGGGGLLGPVAEQPMGLLGQSLVRTGPLLAAQ